MEKDTLGLRKRMQKKAVGVGVQLLKINVIIYFLGVALRELFAILAEPTSD